MAWAPTRLDLYTLPQANGSDPSPWNVQLAAHEPRHQVQLQQGSRKYFKVFNVLTGQLWNPVAYQVFLGMALGEGDAVTAETGLAAGTRARTADFLNYYQVALDQGDYRNWFRWRYGSYKHYTPDHYTVGYLTVAGSRMITGNPSIMHESAQNASKKPWLLSSTFRHTLRQNGHRFKDTFRAILDSVNGQWRQSALERAPFVPMEQITPDEAFPVEYSNPQWIDGALYSIREGYLIPQELVCIRNGKIRHLRYLQNQDNLNSDPENKRLYWSERRVDVRWKMKGTSVVVRYDIDTGKEYTLTSGTLYYNPNPSNDGERLAVVEYGPDGRHAVAALSSEDGSLLRRFPAPAGVQPEEVAWMGEDIYASAVCLGGYALYRIGPDGSWTQLLAPSAQKLSNFGSDGDCVEWVSDRTGVNELYHFYPADGRLVQLTSTRYGTMDHSSDGEYLYSASQTLKGMHLFRTRVSALQEREVEYADVAAYPLADFITAQEQALGPAPDLSQSVPMSAPKRYYKLAHPLRLHSWLPLYVNYDAVKEGSMDFSYETASIGVSGYFQNTLGTLSGMVGYSLHRSPDNRSNWRNSLHAKLVYTGLYPVLEASLDLGDQDARQYYVNAFTNNGNTTLGTGGFLKSVPLVTGSLRAYIPLSWRRRGVNFGFIPQLNYSLSNNWLATEPIQWEAPLRFEKLPSRYALVGVGGETNVLMQRVSASVRGYAILSKADNNIFPRLGIGAEVGASVRPGLGQIFTPNVYAYLYGYLPGIWRTQGLKLTGLVQRQLTPRGQYLGEMSANTLPRGFDAGARSAVAQTSPLQWRVTADYAIPIYVGDINIPGIAYITHFVLTPHADYTGLSAGSNLWSAGADLTAELAKLILPFDSSIGVSFSYLGGSWYKNTGQEKPWSVEMIFSMDF